MFGAFFVLNLMIAIQFDFLNKSFDQIEEQKEAEAKKAKKAADRDQIKKEMGAEESSPEKPKQGQTDDIGESAAANAESNNILNYDDDEEDANKPSKCSICWDEFSEGTDRCCKACCCKCWYDFSESVYNFIQKPYLETIVVILILANSATMASEYHNQPDWLGEVQYWANVVFTILFTLEMIINLIGLGVKQYFANAFNCFDAIVVCLSLFELAAQVIT